MVAVTTRRWWLLAATILLGALAGLGYGVLAPPAYTGTAYVLVVAANPGDSVSAVSYAQAYARLAGQGEVVAAAAAASRGTASPGELRRDVAASASPDAPVIEVRGEAGSGKRAADLANLVADSLVDTGRAQAPSTRMNLVLLSPAYPPVQRSSPRLGLSVGVGAVVGLVVGGLVLLTRPEGGPSGGPGDRAGGRGPDRRGPGRSGDAVASHRSDPVLMD